MIQYELIREIGFYLEDKTNKLLDNLFWYQKFIINADENQYKHDKNLDWKENYFYLIGDNEYGKLGLGQ
jgi:hypothetical protein